VSKTSNESRDNKLTREQRILRLLKVTKANNSSFGSGGLVKNDRYKPKPITLANRSRPFTE
jgi:hypothetical protein